MSNTDENGTTTMPNHWTGIICLGDEVKDAIRKEVRDAIAKELKLKDASDLTGNLSRYVGEDAKVCLKELLDSRDEEIARLKSEVERLSFRPVYSIVRKLGRNYAEYAFANADATYESFVKSGRKCKSKIEVAPFTTFECADDAIEHCRMLNNPKQ
jgi:hypothetical protein